MFILSSVLRRRVVVPSRPLLGSWNAYPNFYIIFVSPPARARKTTTVNYADDLLENIPGITMAAGATTVQALHKKISETKDCSISIRSPEFATFINPSGSAMVDYLTDLYDGKRHHDSETLARALEFAERPCVNLLAATTPKWISENLSESMIGGGFTSRVMYVYEDTVRRRQLFYSDVNYDEIEQLKESLLADLSHLACNIEGQFKIESKETEGYIEDWYKEHSPKWEKEDERLSGYYERKPAHALKLAMLLHLSYDDELVINKTDFDMAIALLRQIEPKMLKVFQSVGKNPYANVMDLIIEWAKNKEKFTKKDYFARFYQAAPPVVLADLMEALMTMGVITLNGSDPQRPMYQYVTGKLPSRPASTPPSET